MGDNVSPRHLIPNRDPELAKGERVKDPWTGAETWSKHVIDGKCLEGINANCFIMCMQPRVPLIEISVCIPWFLGFTGPDLSNCFWLTPAQTLC
jgi:hypothetical protein